MWNVSTTLRRCDVGNERQSKQLGRVLKTRDWTDQPNNKEVRIMDAIQNNRLSQANVLTTDQTKENQALSAVKLGNEQAPQGLQKAYGTLNDRADVSSMAKKLLESEKFGKLVQSLPETISPAVSQLKAMVDEGRMSDILNRYSSTQLADDLLKSPAGAFLR